MAEKLNMSVERVAVKDLLANPYRRIEKYPISEEKIEALIQSYGNSGFWDGSIQGRRTNGKVEIAFGHHRVEAAKRHGLKTLGLVLADRSNADMLRMMADENRTEFKHDARINVETIRAVVEAYGRDEIALKPVPKDTNKMYIHALPGGRAYTLVSLAQFLGWTKKDGKGGVMPTDACRLAFDLFQKEHTTKQALSTLTSEEVSDVAVETVNTAANVARTNAQKSGLSLAKVQEAERRAAAAAVKEIKATSGFKARTAARAIGHKAVRDVAGKKAKLPTAELFIAKLIDFCRVAEPYNDILTKCRMLIPVIDDLDQTQARKLADALEAMLTRSSRSVASVAAALRSGNHKRVVALLNQKGA